MSLNENLYSEKSKYFLDISREEAWSHLEKAKKDPLYKYRTWKDLTFLNQFIKGPKILDFPMGEGRIYPHLMDNYDVYGFDINPWYIEIAQTKYPLIQDHFEQQSFEELTTKHTFDTVITLRVLGGMKDIHLIFKNLSALLNDQGRLIFNYAIEDCKKNKIEDILSSNNLKVIYKSKRDWLVKKNDLGFLRKRIRQYAREIIPTVPDNKKYYKFISLIEDNLPKQWTNYYVVEKAK